MTVERRRPLPAGRYWIDITPKDRKAWDIWRDGMKDIPSVTIEKTEHFEAGESGWNPFGEGDLPEYPERDFVIFSLSSPNLAWEAAGLKSPTIAPAEIQGSADTVNRPPPEPSATEQIASAVGSFGTAAKVGIGIAAAAAVVALIGAIRR